MMTLPATTPMKRRIAIIEDEPAIRQVVVDALDLEGFETSSADTWADGLELGLRAPCDLLLLDLALPGGDGLDLLAEVRMARPTLPVIIMTARGREEDRVGGLKLGADDYVVKPFSIKELIARVEAVLRRSAERPTDARRIRFRGGVADLDSRRLTLDAGGEAELSEREVELLRYLARNAGRTISRDELLERIWRLPPNRVRTRTIDMHVARLRDKLGDPDVIRTVRGKGYCFEGEVE
jgi:DNA-binding response OmpR family regulator